MNDPSGKFFDSIVVADYRMKLQFAPFFVGNQFAERLEPMVMTAMVTSNRDIPRQLAFHHDAVTADRTLPNRIHLAALHAVQSAKGFPSLTTFRSTSFAGVQHTAQREATLTP